MADNLRKSGIEVLGDIPWGSHFSYFYETQQDLLDTEASYFKAGLENNEYCFWILPDINKHLAKEKASDALKKLLPDLNRHLEQGNMEIVSREEWFLKEDIFDLQSVIQNFSEKLKKALAKGYEGMRVNGGSSWLLEVGQGEDLHTLEHTIDKSIANQRVIMLCNFPLKKTMGHEIFDVMHNHKFGIARRNGQWEVFETPELLEAKEE
ncbi:MAG TPA: MEDS domain-containing protein, partial [Flavisolibacter sp.]|nr:MEDS domain-containing protein [Flavisolibacter sp.]